MAVKVPPKLGRLQGKGHSAPAIRARGSFLFYHPALANEGQKSERFMKFFPLATAVLVTALTIFLPYESALAEDGCAASPCQNGGICSPVGDFWFSCSCAQGYLGLTCEYAAAGDEQITVEYSGIYGGGAGWIGLHSSTEESGLGQSFLTSKGGFLEKVSFELFVSPEAVSRPENLIVEIWNVDGGGLPTGSALATRSLPGSGFVADLDNPVRVTANFSADQIKLRRNTQYAFTARVLHKASPPPDGFSLYPVDYSTNPESYPDGAMVRLINSSWQDFGNDWLKFQVTVLGATFEDGFETLP